MQRPYYLLIFAIAAALTSNTASALGPGVDVTSSVDVTANKDGGMCVASDSLNEACTGGDGGSATGGDGGAGCTGTVINTGTCTGGRGGDAQGGDGGDGGKSESTPE